MEQNALLCKESGIHRFFLRFMNNFGLWALAAFTFLYSGIQLFDLWENGAENVAFQIVLNLLLIAAGVLFIRTRFDLAAYNSCGIGELLAAHLVVAAVFILWHLTDSGTDEHCLFKAFLFGCWGIALFRYYSSKSYLFKY